MVDDEPFPLGAGGWGGEIENNMESGWGGEIERNMEQIALMRVCVLSLIF